MKKQICIILLVSILLLSLTWAASSQEKTITIGAAVSMTGHMAREGMLTKDGMEVWAWWVNKNGGIAIDDGNYKIEMVYLDDESDPVRGAKLTERLITEDKVDFLFGPFSSAIAFATSAIGEKYKVITVAPQSNAIPIYERGFQYLFSVLPPATKYLTPIAFMAAEMDPKPKTAAILVANDLFPLSVSEGFEQSCKELGIDVPLFEKFPSGITDLSNSLTKVKAINPDILLIADYTGTAILAARQCKELNVNPKIFIASEGVEIPDFAKELGKDAEYWFGASWWTNKMHGTDKIFGSTQDYVQICKELFGPDYDVKSHCSTGSTAGCLLQLAIEKANSVEPEKVREALRNLDVELSCFPAVAFNEKGQNIKWEHPVAQIQNGEDKVVYPNNMKDVDPWYPTPEWSKR